MLEAETIAWSWLMPLILLAFFGVRIWVRLRVVRKPLTSSDYILSVLQVFNFAAACVTTRMAQFGLARPEAFEDVEFASGAWFGVLSQWPEELTECLKLGLAGYPIYYTILLITKAAYIAIYYNLFRHLERSVKIVLFLSSVYMVISYMVSMLIYFLWCQPFSKAWDWLSPDYCNVEQDQIPFTVAFVCNLSTELILLLIPITLLQKLQLSRRDRWAILFLYLVGGVSISAGVVRFIILQNYASGDLSEGRKGLIWTTVEYFCAEMAVCLPAFRTLITSKSQKNSYREKNRRGASPQPGAAMEMARQRSVSEESQAERGDCGSETELRSQ